MLRVLPAPGVPGETTFEGAVTALKQQLIVDAVKAENGNKVAAARRLGISRSYLHRLFSEFGL
jgi:DNA-binding NtrC family response regulator